MAASSLAFAASFRQALPDSGERKTHGKPAKTARFITRSRFEKPMEELYNVRVERAVSAKRIEELGISRWSMWRTGKCRLPWDWHVDQQVYIVEGKVKVVPEGSEKPMCFEAGDLIRYPKWFEADLYFDGPYEERYRFRAYGDD